MAKITLRSAEKLDRPHWLPRSAFPLQMHFAGIDGRRIQYIDEGSGPALLLVSAGQWSFMFRDVILRLRGQFRCLALDFPGSGLSPDAPGHDHSVRANAQILEGFIDALDLQDITMAVHDAGGPIGFLVAAGRPERFRALVTSNTFGWPLAGYPAVRRTLKVVGSQGFGTVDSLTNVAARFKRRAATAWGARWARPTAAASSAPGAPAAAAVRRSRSPPDCCGSTRSWQQSSGPSKPGSPACPR